MMAWLVLTNHSAYIKHQRIIHALSAIYHIYIPVRSFEVWLHHDIYKNILYIIILQQTSFTSLVLDIAGDCASPIGGSSKIFMRYWIAAFSICCFRSFFCGCGGFPSMFLNLQYCFDMFLTLCLSLAFFVSFFFILSVFWSSILTPYPPSLSAATNHSSCITRSQNYHFWAREKRRIADQLLLTCCGTI